MGQEVTSSAGPWGGGGRQAGAEFPLASGGSASPPRPSSMALRLGERADGAH